MDSLTHFGFDSSSGTKQQRRENPSLRHAKSRMAAACAAKQRGPREQKGAAGQRERQRSFCPAFSLDDRHRRARPGAITTRSRGPCECYCSSSSAPPTWLPPRQRAEESAHVAVPGKGGGDLSLAARKGGGLAPAGGASTAAAEGHRLYPARRIAECFDEMARGRLLIESCSASRFISSLYFSLLLRLPAATRIRANTPKKRQLK